MAWEAWTNTGRMMPGAVFEIIETVQGDGHVPRQPPMRAPITVRLKGTETPIAGAVMLSTERDLVLDVKTATNWRLRRWASGDGPPVQNFPGLVGQHWTVVEEAESD